MNDDSVVSFVDQKKAVKDEQSGKSYDDVKDLMEKRSEFMVELDNLPKQEHNWIDRGAVMSCEGALHPNHHAHKRLK